MKILQGGPLGTSHDRSSTIEPHPARGTGVRFNILFLSADNATSLMAEALLHRWGGKDFRAYCAGFDARDGNVPAIEEFLHTCRVWYPGLRPKSYREFLTPEAPQTDFVISLGDHPPEGMPQTWAGHPKVMHWHISEPKVNGSESERTYSLSKTFAELENRIRLLVLVYQKKEAKRSATAA